MKKIFLFIMMAYMLFTYQKITYGKESMFSISQTIGIVTACIATTHLLPILYDKIITYYSSIHEQINNTYTSFLIKHLDVNSLQKSINTSFCDNYTKKSIKNALNKGDFAPSWKKLVLNQNIKEDLLNHANYVLSEKNTCQVSNIFCLYGLPGTKKTSIVKSLASELEVPLVIVDPLSLGKEYTNITVDKLFNNSNYESPCIVYVKNLEMMPKSFYQSLFKIAKQGIKRDNVLFIFSCNNNILLEDLEVHKSNAIKFIIIESPSFSEAKDLIYQFLSLKEINTHSLDIDRIAIACQGLVHKDIELALQKAIEEKVTNNYNQYYPERILETSNILEKIKKIREESFILSSENKNQLVINNNLKNKDKDIVETPTTSFKDIVGYEEIKEQLGFVVEYLKNPREYKELGLRIPKGILFNGLPGCGKTLMAKALAGEAGVNVLVIQGSNIIDKYVGQGASKLRAIFELAAIYSPAIIFIDEIDAIGRSRSSSSEGGEKEYAQTMNELLVQMDGFDKEDKGIIVIGSTNINLNTLDKALLRRFEKKYSFSLPTLTERKKIAELYLKNTHLSSDISVDTIALKSIHLSGAEIEYLINQAKYETYIRLKNTFNSVEKENFIVNYVDFTKAFDELLTGVRIKNHSISYKSLYETAIHELGHTLAAMLQNDFPKKVELVTINPFNKGEGGISLGHTRYIQLEEMKSYKSAELKKMIISTLGGMIAEKIIFGDSSEGVTGDISMASNIAHFMVKECAMGENTIFNSPNSELSGIEKDQIEAILQECKKTCETILYENKDLLLYLADFLMKEKTLFKKDLDELIQSYQERK